MIYLLYTKKKVKQENVEVYLTSKTDRKEACRVKTDETIEDE